MNIPHFGLSCVRKWGIFYMLDEYSPLWSVMRTQVVNNPPIGVSDVGGQRIAKGCWNKSVLRHLYYLYLMLFFAHFLGWVVVVTALFY
jgi:hypothetical protein